MGPGSTVAATPALGRARMAVRRAETTATATGADGIGIFDVEPAAHQGILIVDRGPVDVEEAGLIHQHVHAVLFGDVVPVPGGLVEGHTVLHASTTTALDKHAQAVTFIHALLGHDRLQPFRGRCRQCNHLNSPIPYIVNSVNRLSS